MSFSPVEIHTRQLRLRPWRLTDVDDAFAYAADPECGRYLWNTPYPYAREHADAETPVQGDFVCLDAGRAAASARRRVVCDG